MLGKLLMSFLAVLMTASSFAQVKPELGMEPDDYADVKAKINDRLTESKAVVQELISGKSNVPNSIMSKAKCLVVVPRVKRIAFTLGGSYGRGTMVCRLGEDYNGRWSPPAMYAVEGGNFGLQFGIQGTDLVLVVMNERGVSSLLRSKFRLGADAGVSAGPVGRNVEAATDVAMRAQILSYSRSHGIFAGVALNGTTVRPDDYANSILYGRDLTARQIVSGEVATPPKAKSYIAFLDENVTTGMNQPPTQARTDRDK